ncbi:uncharacterized protein LOC133822385 isoform X2 [Humulus lupulus]|uniref:uncharacterized protein LOC133822385 isoform X2 n=1 Tax=Humulus lupulus TaxID=3486 RepID=UPI002B40D055|nr:uncharacterized protein LOC133822385 isoform X2 [Humulus lupulus]
MVLEKPQFDPKGPPSAPLHQIDADDDNAKQLKECSSLYLALQDCVNTNRNWKSCQSDFESVEMTQDGMNNTGDFESVEMTQDGMNNMGGGW